MHTIPTMGVPGAGDTAWLLAATAMVFLMTPGLAFFYGGMVRSKSVLNMIMMSFGALAVVGLLWVLVGYSMVFGDDKAGFIGDPGQFFGLRGLLTGQSERIPLIGTVPAALFAVFELTFAVVTVALISGAVADRMRFGPWLVFAGVWALLVYFPVAHWVFAQDGLTADRGGWILNRLHAVDFAGGTVVEVNSGAAALALALVLGRRRGWGRDPMRPHNMPLVMTGAGLLWFGWYGFNAGSALRANGSAATVMVTTTVAACAAMLAWLLVERLRDGHATSLGAASGVVAGLVAITPSCGAVNALGAAVIGLVAGAVCAVAIGLKYRFGYDDSLDVVGVHLVGGVVGTLLIGVVAAPQMSAGAKGLFYGGGLDQLWRQAVAVLAVFGYSFVISFVIATILKYAVGLRASREHEVVGLDEMQHAESAYDFGGLSGGSVTRHALSMSGAPGQRIGSRGGPTGREARGETSGVDRETNRDDNETSRAETEG